jgi:type III pantothenate kinase
MPVRYTPPSDVGADRIVNGVAAFARYGGPAVVVDFGTATTFDAISRDGEYLGGVICPGLQISAEALFSRAARLPRVEIARPDEVIGTTTVGSIQSGLFYGYVGLVEGILHRMLDELGPDTRVVATGGLASLIGRGTNLIEVVDSDLTLEGLRLIYERNK